MSKTKQRLLAKLRSRPETAPFVRDSETPDRVVINRGGYGECVRWAIPCSGIQSDSTASDVLRCRKPLVVFGDNPVYVEVPNSEMRRLHPERAAKGIYS